MTWLPSALIEALMPHLSIAPILLPLLTACVLLFLSEHRLRTKTAVSLAAALLNLILAVGLFSGPRAAMPRAPTASTCPRTGMCPSASCSCSTACRP